MAKVIIVLEDTDETNVKMNISFEPKPVGNDPEKWTTAQYEAMLMIDSIQSDSFCIKEVS